LKARAVGWESTNLRERNFTENSKHFEQALENPWRLSGLGR
jgi:hypothetical protein